MSSRPPKEGAKSDTHPKTFSHYYLAAVGIRGSRSQEQSVIPLPAFSAQRGAASKAQNFGPQPAVKDYGPWQSWPKQFLQNFDHSHHLYHRDQTYFR